MRIIRADGSSDVFNPKKLERSLERSGATSAMAKNIAKEVSKSIKEGDTTKAIYKKAFSFLKKQEKPVAALYSLKQAIMDLGPTGYPFEQLIGRLFEHEGYKVSYPEVILGKCIGHEVDVVAEKGKQRLMIEAKFHNQQGFRSDIKTALYVKSRCDDIKATVGNKNNECWIITNTKFSSDAVEYSKCAGVNLLGWNYPKGSGLEQKLEVTGILPVTILTCLNKTEKESLLRNNIVACRDIAANPSVLKMAGIKGHRAIACTEEVQKILNVKK